MSSALYGYPKGEMFDFKAEVRLNADAPPEQIAARLAAITAPPFSIKRTKRQKPLRGRPAARQGSLRWPFNEYRIASPRILEFDLVEARDGAVLTGAFHRFLPLRVVVLTSLALANLFWLWTLATSILHRTGPKEIAHNISFLAAGWCMAAGYLWVAAAFGKRRDRDLI